MLISLRIMGQQKEGVGSQLQIYTFGSNKISLRFFSMRQSIQVFQPLGWKTTVTSKACCLAKG